eukprot:CAMPEP_0182444012 /NCGR_PEP_ID=MMETSP1172-20130603/2595_1 /TAXON_ID=708627 /ORGANISM="Timspurckia oligopyrenoides, Strain CCMP3278" /LENGTH=326 /DNA_ID=CAMNT_0024639461 /DNA_START=200 /DNA_END=1177 /DNA_ORIENTATION=+
MKSIRKALGMVERSSEEEEIPSSSNTQANTDNTLSDITSEIPKSPPLAPLGLQTDSVPSTPITTPFESLPSVAAANASSNANVISVSNPDQRSSYYPKDSGSIGNSMSAVCAVGFTEDANPRFRPTMEDGHVILDKFRGRAEEAFFAVYDGHGGRKAVDIVNGKLHGIFAEELEQWDPPRAFYEAYRRVDDLLAENKCQYVGTTSVTCYICKDAQGRTVLYTANAGDARAVLCRNGNAVRLSYDHKASDVSELKRVSDSGGFVAAKRVNGVLSVSRALGDHAMKNVVICAPHVTKEFIDVENMHLIIACDGLWDVMSDEDAVKFVW